MPPPPDPFDDTQIRSTLSHASKAWSHFDLDSRRPHLDATALQTKKNHTASLTSRKTLAELVKNFKKSFKNASGSASSSPALTELLDAGRPLVRAFQTEVDALTKRCKTSDAAFTELYQNFFELPDPAGVLAAAEHAMDSYRDEVSGLRAALKAGRAEVEEMADLKRELADYEKEFATLKNQDITIRKLEGAVASLEEELGAARLGGGSGADDEASSALTSAERDELIKLRTEVAEYEVEFRGLKNQDITIRKLEARIADMEERKEEEMAKELAKARDELIETEGRRAAEALEREAKMEGTLRSVELQLRAERAGREVTQSHMLKAGEGAEMREAAWEAQRQILVSDAERSRELLQEVTRERDELSLKLGVMDFDRKGGLRGEDGNVVVSAPASGAGMGVADIIAEKRAYEAEVNELTMTTSSLREEMRMKDESYMEERKNLDSTIQSLEDEIGSLRSQISTLQAQLSSAPSAASFEKMKRELRVLKRLEYNAELDDKHDNPEMTDQQDLETVLVSRLQKAESDLLKEKREKNDISRQLIHLNKQISDLEHAKQENENLVASLERDLHQAIAASSPSQQSTASSPNTDSKIKSLPAQSAPGTLQNILDPSSPSQINTAATPQASVPPTPPADHTVASIIMSQRDRLRTRCDTLEAERDSFKKELQIQVKLSESLKTDNTKLYEKVRYLQNFSSQTNRRNNTSADRDLDLEALEERYEASVDPFRQFNRAERARKLKEMSPTERIVFVTSKFVLASKQMRTGLFVYVMSMHFLVFVTTYHWSHEVGCHDLSDHEALAHMHGGVPLDETVIAAGGS